jgi:HAD superfamily hydrolase (TIGR01493 family)
MICLMIEAVMFDFSGTLFHTEDTASWLRGALRMAGVDATEAEVADYAERLHESGGQAGGRPDVTVPARLTNLWARRDLTASDHRAVYTALVEQVDLPWPGLADILYDRHYAPEAWDPYPDTAAVLELLSDHSIPVAVVSNIGWDLRTVFKAYGFDRFVSAYVLSYEVGVKKPDPEIFRIACGSLGHDPASVLMVGDDRTADAGATAIGCAFHAVDHVPVRERPDALSNAVARLRPGL